MKDISTYNDQELMSLLKGNKKVREAAFSLVYDRYSSMIVAYCRMIIGSTEAAEDIFQETFIRFFNSINKNAEISNIAGYLRVIARNLCYNHQRDRKPSLAIEDIELSNEIGENYEEKQLLELIINAVELLEEKYRAAFIMKEFDGMTYKEIADNESISYDNAKMRYLRAKRQIIQILDPYLKDIQKY